jgi:hypothetical protein
MLFTCRRKGKKRVDMKPAKRRLYIDNTRAIPRMKTLACVLARSPGSTGVPPVRLPLHADCLH